MNLQTYTESVRNYLQSNTDFYDLISQVEEQFDMDEGCLLLASSNLIAKAYILDTPIEVAATAIYSGFITAALGVLGNLRLDKSRMN